MKHAPTIAGALLGLMFVASALTVLLGLLPMPEMPEDSLPYHFMTAFVPSGYMTFVKICELIGGLLLLVPKVRNFGLLIIGPLLVNILAFHQFVAKDGIFQPILIGISLLAAYLLWVGRRAFGGLMN